MFDLEQAIADWRGQMLAAGINTPAPLEELESHLREAIDQEIPRQESAQKAFRAAVQQIGTPESIKVEFNKNQEMTIMKCILIVSVGIIAILVGMGFVMPAVAQYRHEGAMVHEEVLLFWLGTVLTLGGGIAAILGLKRRLAH